MPTPRVLSLDCPKCGAPLKASTQAVECPYCHASLLVDLNQNEKTSSLPNRIIISDPLPLEMILIPGGEFLMGADPNVVDHNVNGCGPCGTTDEYPQHTVYVSDFYISKYPITWQQSALFMQRTGSKPSQGEAFIPFRDPQHARYYKWVEDARKDTNNGNRIEKITWDDSVKMNGWLSRLTGYSFDLPTEAEWEKAARGTDGRLFPWGNVLNAAYELDESDYLHSEDGKYCIEMPMIGSHSPVTDSPYGVSDMLTYLQWVKDQPNFEGYQGRVGKVVKDPYQKPGGAIEWFGKQLDPNTHLAKGKALYRPENPHIPESEAYLTVSARIFVMSTCAFRPVIRIKPLVPSVIEPKEKPQPTEIAPSQVENSQPLSERQNPVTPTISQGKVSLKLGDFAAAIDPIPVRAQSVKIITPLSNPNNAWTWHMPAAIYEYIKHNVKYVFDPPGRNYIAPPLETLKIGGGDCEDQAILFASMCEAVGIPTRLVVCNSTKGDCHCLAEVNFGKNWPAKTIGDNLALYYQVRSDARQFYWDVDASGQLWVIADLTMGAFFGDIANLEKYAYILRDGKTGTWRWLKPAQYTYPSNKK